MRSRCTLSSFLNFVKVPILISVILVSGTYEGVIAKARRHNRTRTLIGPSRRRPVEYLVTDMNSRGGARKHSIGALLGCRIQLHAWSNNRFASTLLISAGDGLEYD